MFHEGSFGIHKIIGAVKGTSKQDFINATHHTTKQCKQLDDVLMRRALF